MTLPFLTTSSNQIGGIAGKLVDLMESIGGPGVAIAVASENLFPPIPSELILPLAGFTASQADANMTVVGAIIWATIGSLVGATVLYYLGYAIGRDRVRAIVLKMPLVKITDLDRTEAWYLKHQTKSVFFGRMIPIFRSLISIPAGVERMKFSLFLLYTAAGSLIWNTALIVAGYQLGSRWDEVQKYVGAFQKLVVVAVIVVLIWIGWYLYKNRERKPTDVAE
ncbi:MAG: DedA family protein [Solirubrobacterales bacterium]|nr:DedA family protein [Solirubrobacterales bacterium]